jgi:hypothetical protein
MLHDRFGGPEGFPSWLPPHLGVAERSRPSVEPRALPEDPELPTALEVGELSARTMLHEMVTAVSTPAAGASSPGHLLTASLGGHLRCYSLPDLRLRGDWRLPRPIYDMVVDSRSGLLFTVCAEEDHLNLGPRDDRPQTRGDLVVYDCRAWLAGRGTPEKDLRPAWTFLLHTQIHGLQLDQRAENLLLLTSTAQGAFLIRLDLRQKKIQRWRQLPLGGGTLRLAPDGRTLYVTTPGQVLALDPASFAYQASIGIQGCATQLVAGSHGRVFLSERGQRIDLLELDFARKEIVGRWSLLSLRGGPSLRGRLSLVLSPDEKHLFVSNTTTGVNQIWCLTLDGVVNERLLLTERAFGNQTGRLRGPSFVTADGTLLINSGGLVFPLDSRSGGESPQP